MSVRALCWQQLDMLRWAAQRSYTYEERAAVK